MHVPCVVHDMYSCFPHIHTHKKNYSNRRQTSCIYVYPLVNVYVTMENHHVYIMGKSTINGNFQYCSYVCLPEGIFLDLYHTWSMWERIQAFVSHLSRDTTHRIIHDGRRLVESWRPGNRNKPWDHYPIHTPS